MNQINPFVGAILSSPAAQRQAEVEKARQIRRLQELRRNIAASEDSYEHEVESSEELAEIHEQKREQERPTGDEGEGREESPAEGEKPPTLDLTA